MCLLQDGYTALISAAANGHQSVVKVLIKAGASLDMQDKVDVVYIK